VKDRSKYHALFDYLHNNKQEEIKISLSKLEKLIDAKLPLSAHTTKAWWSNRKSGGLQSQAWLAAGYRVIAVDLLSKEVTFGKDIKKFKAQRVGESIIWNGVMIEALRRHMKLNQFQFAAEIGVRQQTVSEWERGKYQPKRSMSKLLTMIAERIKFKY